MLGNGAGLHAKEDQRAGTSLRSCDFRHHAPSTLGQHFARAGLAPIPAIRRDRERFWPDDLTPDAPGEPKAIAANALETGLVVIRRAEPSARRSHDAQIYFCICHIELLTRRALIADMRLSFLTFARDTFHKVLDVFSLALSERYADEVSQEPVANFIR